MNAGRPYFCDLASFLAFVMCWSSLLSTGYGQQVDSATSIISNRPGGLHPLFPSASGAGTRQGPIANPVSQALSTAALAAPVRPRVLPLGPN